MKIIILFLVLFLLHGAPLNAANKRLESQFGAQMSGFGYQITSFRVESKGSKRTCYFKGTWNQNGRYPKLRDINGFIIERRGKVLKNTKAKINRADNSFSVTIGDYKGKACFVEFTLVQKNSNYNIERKYRKKLKKKSIVKLATKKYKLK